MYSAPLSLQTAETKWYRVTGSWVTPLTTKQNSGKLENSVLRPADQFLSLLLYDCTSPLPTSGTQTFKAIKQKQVEQASTKGCTGPTTQQVFSRKPSFLHCLSSTASPQAKTLLTGQAQLCCFCSCTDVNTGCNHADWNPTFELLPHSIK